jgi:6-pyruvoyl-tetrahydropterin synthase
MYKFKINCFISFIQGDDRHCHYVRDFGHLRNLINKLTKDWDESLIGDLYFKIIYDDEKIYRSEVIMRGKLLGIYTKEKQYWMPEGAE